MIDALSMIVLLDDTATRPGLKGEHGLSLWIRWGGHSMLFDTGQSARFLDNAQELGVEVTRPDVLVLSHGHYDHGGGLPDLLAAGVVPRVVAHPGVTVARWSCKPGMAPRAIGLDDTLREREGLFSRHATPVEVAPGCTFLGAIPRFHPEGSGVRHFYLDPEGREPDRVEDDSGVVFDTREGLVLVTGCGHAGVANYLAVVKARWPDRPLRMVVGGLHLQAATEPELENAVAALESSGVGTVAAMHCTGSRGAEALAASDRFETLTPETGSWIRVGAGHPAS